MKTEVSRVIWTFVSLSVPSVAALVATPFLISGMGVYAFGILSILLALFAASGALDLGLGRGIILYVERIRKNGQYGEIQCAFWSGTLISAGVGAIVSIFFYLYSSNIFPQNPAELTSALDRNIFHALCVSALFTIFPGNFCKSYLEAEGNFHSISLVRAICGVLYFAVPSAFIALVGSVPNALQSVAAVRILHSIFLAALAIAVLRRKHDLLIKINKKTARDLLGAGGWIFFSNIVAFLLGILDKFLIGKVLGVGVVALYAAPVDLISRISLVPSSIVTVIFPRFASIGAEEIALGKSSASGHRFISLSIITTSGICAIVLLPISYFAEDLLQLWLRDAFSYEMLLVMRIMCVGYFANFSAYIIVAHLNSMGQSRTISIVIACEILLFALIYWAFYDKPTLSGICILLSGRMLLDYSILHVFSVRLRIKANESNPLIVTELALLAIIIVAMILIAAMPATPEM